MPDSAPTAPAESRFRRVARRALYVVGGVAVIALPFGVRALARHMAFFRARQVEIEGARYITPDQIVSRMRVDTAASIWDDSDVWEGRIAEHPQVREVRITRRLPGTLVVHITEVPPVALVPTGAGLTPYDAAGRPLPIDPTAVDVDLPVVAARDVAALRLLGDVRETIPQLFARISDVRRLPRGELALQVDSLNVLGARDLTASRLSDILPVERDLARRGRRAVELDLRYRDQVIARLP
ncbi:MAG: FtsQ-type POTRA domain-containing protein [Gemmatimonadaceae bacterium]|nr:FtsQ-type POTRA domain-containing protein [Gemmatimonadaceae bacterium]